MNKPEMLNNTSYEFNVWDSSYDPSFSEISIKSRLPEKWLSFQRVLSDKRYADSIIKPINWYVASLYPPPELISVEGNTVRLRQYTHAEIFILVNEQTNKFLDRPWMRQFYKSSYAAEPDDECFSDMFVAYTPWVLDLKAEIFFECPTEEQSAIKIINTNRFTREIPKNTVLLEPFMIPFRFKNVGEHMVDPEFGKIKKPTAIYDMVFQASDIIIERVKEFYAKD